MTGSTPPWKRRSPRWGADQGPSDGPHRARDDERGSFDPGASLEPAAGRVDLPVQADRTRTPAPVAKRRVAAIRDRAREGVRKGGSRARAGLAYVTDRIIENAPRIPVRDLATLRRQFPGLGPEELADKLVTGAASATATVGAGIGAAAMLPVPPAMPTELAAEITGVAAIELKLIAELHEVYGVRPPGNLKQRSTAYLDSWSGERGIDVKKPSTFNSAVNSHMKQQLRQQIMKRTIRDLPNLMPFMVGAAVGAVMNRRDTRKLAERIRKDLRKTQVPWDALPELPALETPADPLELEG
ncbi:MULTISPECIES: hypothetical protein [unclassified Streptomyces]|uniref:hypothetical protein n=1 Tax=unclassified Streptomyces TaxID=2593676 RepID=UPI000F4D3CE3|nr:MULTISPECIES: hypothetical protein [unclassified Streptomyces]MDH6453454.1 hypothetical protein [Streptomyces sp. SAI-119]MDH6495991.1 hypothetical protein [Streptomyces sp. SAI-149]QUC57148.1 hypothetical protein IOD14_10275 [Streptomyces sp. A2-16]GLP63501.1 hypothetical protein TUSST3_01220 [Streptomyces sp. TUS-ST3]